MSLKNKAIGGLWAAACGTAGYKSYRNAQEFEDETPCLATALEKLSASVTARDVLGNGELKVAFWNRKRRIDEVAGQARADFEVRGDAGSARVFMSARRGATAQKAFEEALEEEEEELSGFRYYWSRPWEIKRLLIDNVTGVVARRPWAQAAREDSAEEEVADWNLDTICFLPGGDASIPSVLLGDARGIPEFEAVCVRDDSSSKSARSQKRLYAVLGTVTGIALMAGVLRVIKSRGVSKTYGYVRQALLAHPAVVDALGPRASISTSSGTFQSSYLNARLRLVGDSGTVADVDFAATKASAAMGGTWRVALARMSWAGRSQNLDKNYF